MKAHYLTKTKLKCIVIQCIRRKEQTTQRCIPNCLFLLRLKLDLNVLNSSIPCIEKLNTHVQPCKQKGNILRCKTLQNKNRLRFTTSNSSNGDEYRPQLEREIPALWTPVSHRSGNERLCVAWLCSIHKKRTWQRNHLSATPPSTPQTMLML